MRVAGYYLKCSGNAYFFEAGVGSKSTGNDDIPWLRKILLTVRTSNPTHVLKQRGVVEPVILCYDDFSVEAYPPDYKVVHDNSSKYVDYDNYVDSSDIVSSFKSLCSSIESQLRKSNFEEPTKEPDNVEQFKEKETDHEISDGQYDNDESQMVSEIIHED